jgi:hypothetical protein
MEMMMRRAFAATSLTFVMWGVLQVMAQSAASADPAAPKASNAEVHDHYYYIADDILDLCKPRKGVWVEWHCQT